jgi:hypothetical protein
MFPAVPPVDLELSVCPCAGVASPSGACRLELTSKQLVIQKLVTVQGRAIQGRLSGLPLRVSPRKAFLFRFGLQRCNRPVFAWVGGSSSWDDHDATASWRDYPSRPMAVHSRWQVPRHRAGRPKPSCALGVLLVSWSPVITWDRELHNGRQTFNDGSGFPASLSRERSGTTGEAVNRRARSVSKLDRRLVGVFLTQTVCTSPVTITSPKVRGLGFAKVSESRAVCAFPRDAESDGKAVCQSFLSGVKRP